MVSPPSSQRTLMRLPIVPTSVPSLRAPPTLLPSTTTRSPALGMPRSPLLTRGFPSTRAGCLLASEGYTIPLPSTGDGEVPSRHQTLEIMGGVWLLRLENCIASRDTCERLDPRETGDRER